MSGMTYDPSYTGQHQCDTCKQGACGVCWNDGGDINKLACANLDQMSYGHGVHKGHECGECVFLKCVDEGTDGGSCKDKSVFAHVRVDNGYAASETETSPHFFGNWNDKGQARNYYQWKPNPDCKLTDS